MKQPVIFIGHGSPMNAIEENIYTKSWEQIGKAILVKPRAILMISAHWITEWETRINTTWNPKMIYDMYGLPPELYTLQYSCPGSLEIAEEIIELFSPEYKIIPDDQHGIDHGAWSTLIHLFSEADIPVIQMSLDYSKSPEWHYNFWKQLKNLREQGILIIGSGNFVHNLRAIDWTNQIQYPWAIEFDDRFASAIREKKYESLFAFKSWWDISRLAHPTHDHILPIFPLLGALDDPDSPRFYTGEITLGSLSMRSVVWSE